MAANAGVSTGDDAMQYKLWPYPLNPVAMNGVVLVAGTPPVIVSHGAGAPVVAAAVGSTKLGGILLDTADEVSYEVVVAKLAVELDLDRDLLLELIFTSLKTTAHAAIDFKAFAKGFAVGETLTSPMSTPDVGITYAAQSVASTALVCSVTLPLGAPGVFNDDALLGLIVELDDKGDGAADETVLLGAILWGTRELCAADGVKRWT